MRFIKAFFGRITKDFKQKELLPLKILFFVHASTLFVLYPYLTIHMRELGINVEETAIMSAVTPVVAIVMPPLAGMVADKIGNFKLLLSVFSLMGGAAALLLLLVPVGRVTVTFPPRADLLLACPAHSLNASAAQFSCEPTHPYAFDVDMRLEICGVVCEWPSGNSSMNLTNAESYFVQVRSPKEESTKVFRYTVTPEDLPEVSSLLDQNSKRIIHDSQRYRTSVRRISHTALFFPTYGMYGLNCEPTDENSTEISCAFGNTDISNETDKLSDIEREFNFMAKVIPLSKESTDKIIPLSLKNEDRHLKMFGIERLSKDEAKKRLSSMTKKEQLEIKLSKATCSDFYGEQEREISVELLFGKKHDKGIGTTPSPEVKKFSVSSCTPQCLASTPRQGLCSNLKEEVELDPALTFWSYMAVRVFIGIIGGTAFAMFEGAVIAILREHEADYGLQRIYGSIGGMISSPLSGLLIDYASRDKGYADFRPAFYLYAVLKVVSAILMMTINLEFKSPATNLIKDVVSVLKNAEIVALFVACFVLGSIWGYIESFLFWLLQDLGGSRSLMGVTITVGGIAGIPLLVMSGPIIQKIGHANVLFIGFIFYAIRLMGYSLIYNPWMCLIFEALEGVTSSLAFTAAVTYAARLSTTTTDTSIQGLLGGIYYGVGKGAGSLVGGYLMKAFGTRPTYQMFACAAVITGCAYFLFNKLYLMKRPRREANDICKKSNKPNKTDIPDVTLISGNEKLRLKDKKTTNLYSENAPTKIGTNIYQIGDEQDDKTVYARESSRTQLTQDGSNGYGLDNPTYQDTEAPPSSNIVQRVVNGAGFEMEKVDGSMVQEKNSKNSEK